MDPRLEGPLASQSSATEANCVLVTMTNYIRRVLSTDYFAAVESFSSDRAAPPVYFISTLTLQSRSHRVFSFSFIRFDLVHLYPRSDTRESFCITIIFQSVVYSIFARIHTFLFLIFSNQPPLFFARSVYSYSERREN